MASLNSSRRLRREAVLMMALRSQVISVSAAWVFSALGIVGLVLLGHWGCGVYLALSMGGFDLGFQAWCRRRMHDADNPVAAGTLGRLAIGLAIRHSLLLSGAAAAFLRAPGLAETAYLSITACTVLVLALTQCNFSRSLLTASAAPALPAFLVLGFGLAGAPGAAGVLIASLILTALVGAAAVLTLRQRKEIIEAQAEKAAMIEELAQARDQALVERGAAEASREEARRADAAKSVFLAAMSHEIRTPMNGVLGMTQVLRRSTLTIDQRDQVEMLMQSGEHLMGLLNDILDWSKIDAGSMGIAPTATDLPGLLQQAAAFWRSRVEDKGLQFHLDLAPDLPRHINIDPLRLKQILFNLVGNAVKFTPSGRLTVSCAIDGAMSPKLVLTVADTGVGMTPEVLDRLFARFVQASAETARTYGGTGLGLAISRRLAELMGGGLEVASRAGQGSTFKVTLPLEYADPPAKAAVNVDDSLGRAMHVLTIDDHTINLKVVELLLGAAGHRVICARSVDEGLGAAAGEVFDIIFTDMHMPARTGLDFLSALRSGVGPNRDTPVFVLTADARAEDLDAFMRQGFSGHVTKPIAASDLLGALQSVQARVRPVGATAGEPARILTGPIALEPAPTMGSA